MFLGNDALYRGEYMSWNKGMYNVQLTGRIIMHGILLIIDDMMVC